MQRFARGGLMPTYASLMRDGADVWLPGLPDPFTYTTDGRITKE